MRTRATLRTTARLMLAALLFAQAALAIAACNWLVRAPAQVFAAPQAPSCHEAPAKNANLCLAHCLGEDQSSATPQLPVFTAATMPVLLLPVAPMLLAVREARAEAPPPGPPPRIRFRSFRI